MNCQDVYGILDDGDSRGLSAAERRALDAHLAGCAECRAALRAHEAMSAMAVPAMSAGLAEQCRRLVVAKAAGPARRAGGRPFFVVGLLFAGAAAATFVGLQVVGESGVESNPAVGAIGAPEPPESIDETNASPSTDAIADAAPAVADIEGVAPGGGFTVAVRPANIATTPGAASAYYQFLEGLRKVPNLELVELDELDAADAPPPAAEPVTSVATLAGVNLAGVDAQSPDAGPRTLVLVDSRNLATSSGAAVDMSQIPTALRGRIETVTGGASATYSADAAAGVVNVILDNNIPGVRVDMSYSSASPDASVEPYDFMIDVIADAPASSEVVQLSVRARSRDGTSSLNRAVLSPARPAGDAETIAQLITWLQDRMFPVDAATLEAIERRVLDLRLSLDERVGEVERLKEMNERLGVSQLPEEVALAIVDMATRFDTTSRAGSQRLMLLSALQGMDYQFLIQPMSNFLRNDTNVGVRSAAVTVLAQFRDNPQARAALEVAANSDARLEVRRSARLALLDEEGRREYVIATLLDTRLGDAERLDALGFYSCCARGDSTSGLGSAIDVTVANELASLLRRHESANSRAQLLSRLQRESSPALTPLFIERLNEDSADGVRRAAASALSGRLDEPGARQALERAAAGDPSAGVREVATRILEGQSAGSMVVIGN